MRINVLLASGDKEVTVSAVVEPPVLTLFITDPM